MTIDSLSILRHLQALEHQLAEVPRHDQALRAANARGDRQTAQRVAVQAERHVRAMAVTIGHLKAQVPADDLGSALESLSELALRAARLVVLTELDALHELVRAHPSRSLSWGRFWGIEDLMVCARAELDRITATWCAYRGRAQTDRPVYRAALHAAHAAMRKLGTASEFARFLWEGRHRTDWPALQALCTQVSAALTLRVDVERRSYRSSSTTRGPASAPRSELRDPRERDAIRGGGRRTAGRADQDRVCRGRRAHRGAPVSDRQGRLCGCCTAAR